jgi:hypothetical protein
MRKRLTENGHDLLRPTYKKPWPKMPDDLKELLRDTTNKSMATFLSFCKENGPVDHGRVLWKVGQEHQPLPPPLQAYLSQCERYLQDLNLEPSLPREALKILPKSVQVIYTALPGMMPQLMHTDHKIDLDSKAEGSSMRPIVYSVIVARDAPF